MQNKSKNLTDVQLIISSISIAVTLGFWSLFASHEKTGAGVSGDVLMPSQPDALASNPTSIYPTTLLPGQKLIFGSTLPQSQQPQQPATTTSRRRGRGGGGGGGGSGGGGGASTGSSH
jgi:uncharacterized membrane protein YgcG